MRVAMAIVVCDEQLTVLESTSDCRRLMSGPQSAHRRGEIVRVTTQTKPEEATHWSTCKLAAQLSISDTNVFKVWQANGLSRIWSRPSRHREIRRSLRNSKIPLGCIRSRRGMPWCCAAMRKVRCKHLTYPYRFASQEETGGNDDPRLQTPRHDYVVRGEEHAGWFGGFPLRPTSPPCRMA